MDNKYLFTSEDDWYTAQRLLGSLSINFNYYEQGDFYIIELY